LQQQVIDRLGLIIALLLLAYSEGDQTVNIADLIVFLKCGESRR
jgi:hypothetical protein